MRDPDNGQCLIIGACAALDECACIGVAPYNYARDGRGYGGVILERLHALIVAAGCLSVLLRGSHCGLRGVHLRLRAQVLGLRVIQLLLRNQAGPRCRCLLQPPELSMDGRVHCFSALELVLRSRDLFLGLLQIEGGLFKLGFQFWNVENRERLPFVHNIADIDIDALHVPANLGVHVDHLIRLKLVPPG